MAPILLGNNGVPLFTSDEPIINRYRQEKTLVKGDDIVGIYVRL